MKRSKIQLSCIFFLCIITLSYGTPSLKSFKEKHPNRPLKLPKEQSFSGHLFSSNGLLMSPYQFSMKRSPTSNQIITKVITEKTTSILITDPQLTPLKEIFTSNSDEMTKFLGYQKREGVIDSAKVMHFTFEKNGDKSSKKAYYSPNAIDSFTLIPTLQHYLHYGLKDFTCHYIIQDRAIKVSLNFNYSNTNDISTISPEYTLPNFATTIPRLKQDIIAYQVTVTGFWGLFYKYKHYYLFQATPPHKYIGTWGGAPDAFFLDLSIENLPK